MLGLDTWNGSQSQVEGFRRNGGITFPMLLNAGGSAPASYENFVVVGPNGTVALPATGNLSSSSVTSVKNKVNELLAPPPPPPSPPPSLVPAISVQQAAIDFGTVDAGQTVEKTITVTNTGTASLEITGIESDVPGLTFDTTTFTVEPGGSRTVAITFPKSMEGEFSGSINILSNDPDRARFMLTISGVVQPLSEEAKLDFDGDGMVGITDFLLFVEAFGSSEAQYDIDGDGIVGIADFLLFVSVFGKTVNG
ncbi:MAG: choice-of-anchor D domain-containing protein [Candidatus Latescibacteria bacterium]|nr:choice-of-anchor D domain-containing protein [Candidatus Latescibacterota bacterium]